MRQTLYRMNAGTLPRVREMTAELHNALLIHNPNAGNGGHARRRTLDKARHIFANGGIVTEIAETTGPGHATEIAYRAASEGRHLVIACGGDGTPKENVHGPATPQNRHRRSPALFPPGTPNILPQELQLTSD